MDGQVGCNDTHNVGRSTGITLDISLIVHTLLCRVLQDTGTDNIIKIVLVYVARIGLKPPFTPTVGD